MTNEKTVADKLATMPACNLARRACQLDRLYLAADVAAAAWVASRRPPAERERLRVRARRFRRRYEKYRDSGEV